MAKYHISIINESYDKLCEIIAASKMAEPIIEFPIYTILWNCEITDEELAILNLTFTLGEEMWIN